MARPGTLLDTVGRPEDRVEIIRKSKKITRIRRSTNNGRSWSPADQLVAIELILDDGGARFDQHAQNPGHATYLGLAGTPQARLRIQRVYAVITKAQVYLGDNTWSDIQDFPTRDLCFDGGAGIGWTISTWHHPASTTNEPDGHPSEPAEEVEEKQPESEPAVAPATTPTTELAVPTSAALVPTPKGQQFSYLRVSSTDPNLARQRAMIGAVTKEFIDELSARSRAHRPGLDNCIDYLRDHDELYVASIDRLARSLVDLRGIIDQITAKGASVHFIKENLTFSKDSTDPRDTLMLSILGSFAEFERSIIRERQAEGIALAKKAGKYKGAQTRHQPRGPGESPPAGSRRRIQGRHRQRPRRWQGHPLSGAFLIAAQGTLRGKWEGLLLWKLGSSTSLLFDREYVRTWIVGRPASLSRLLRQSWASAGNRPGCRNFDHYILRPLIHPRQLTNRINPL